MPNDQIEPSTASTPNNSVRPSDMVPDAALTALGLWVAVLVFALDQTHKWWMLLVYRMKEKGRVPVAPFMDFVYVINHGVSYGMMTAEDPRWQIALAAFAVAVSVGLVVWLRRSADSRVLAVSIGLIVGGALGNALDRLLIGGVFDYVSLHAFGFHWYVFNIADVAIVAGVAGLMYDFVYPNRTAR